MRIVLELKPFMTPNFAIIKDGKIAQKQDGFQGSKSIALKDISQETLLEMCEQFKRDVLKKAGYL